MAESIVDLLEELCVALYGTDEEVEAITLAEEQN